MSAAIGNPDQFPVVSVGLPVYNGENYLRAAIDSILSQTYTDFELIISDNASTDATEEICRSFASHDDRVRYIRHDENRGAAFNFNHVVHEARGRYFKWHAHDDGCLPGYLAACVAAFESAPDSVVLCQCRSVLIDEQGEQYANYGQERNNIDHDRPCNRLRQLIDELRLCTYVFGLMRTDTLRQTRMIDRFVSSDVVLLVEMVLRGKFLMVQDFEQLRRVHDESSRLRTNDARAIRAWFDPSARGFALHPRLKYGVECIRSIGRAPLTNRQRMRCMTAFTVGAIRRRSAADARERSRAHTQATESGAQKRQQNGSFQAPDAGRATAERPGTAEASSTSAQ